MKPLNLNGSKIGQTATAAAAQRSGTVDDAQSARNATQHLGHPKWHTWRIWGKDSTWIHKNESGLFFLKLVLVMHLVLAGAVCFNWTKVITMMTNLRLVEMSIWIAIELFALVVVCGISRDYLDYRRGE